MERWIHCVEKHRGPIFSVWGGDAALDDGTVVTREVVRHCGSVAVVPVKDSSLLLVRQFRISIDRPIVEVPAGRIEPGEEPEAAGRRELEEELGYTAVSFIRGSSYYSSVGFTDEHLQVFLAFGLRETRQRPEADERIEVVTIPLQDIGERLRANYFEDSKTIIGLHDLLAYLAKEDQHM